MITRKRNLVIIFMIALMWVVCASAWAETIRLKNGRIFEGEFVEERDDEFKILMKSGLMTFSRDEIASIGERKISQEDIKDAVKSLSAPAPAKKPAVKKAKTSSAIKAKPAQKNKRKAATKVKNKVTPSKVVQPKTLPAAVTDTATVTLIPASTETAPSVSSAPIISSVTNLPVRQSKKLTPSAKAAIVTIALAIIAIIVFIIIKRRKKPKDI